jgi:hypothetical protein
MPDWLVMLLFVVFLVHLMIFVRLGIVRGDGYYWLVSSVFLVLTASFGLRIWAPEIQVVDQPLYQMLRYLAWLLAAITIPTMIWRRVRAKK